MNKTKMTFLSGLALLGLEAKAQEALTADFRKELKAYAGAVEAVDKVENAVEQYNTLADNLTTQEQMMTQAVAELKEEITKQDVTSPDFVDNVKKVNREIEFNQDKIKAIASAKETIKGKAQADVFEVLAEGYRTIRELNVELSSLIDTVETVVNSGNKAQIVKALQTLHHELNGLGYALNSVSTKYGLARYNHNGIVFDVNTNSISRKIDSLSRK
ncbi:hypothetical protein J32TS6_12370 [Virgibacillus pantothenticus]|uniref:hypothetical protein n=1 Tax=Virgibacillus pantothenticus TaxID=1473 RepID=UPI001B1BF7B5|nr:hypothetical protein [Virgibacillus pantothenticus]GIP62682.1 hypothetical protein J32TS6_12370 [Virgibacillus pantothenticus]